jgi:hypothetical protein
LQLLDDVVAAGQEELEKLDVCLERHLTTVSDVAARDDPESTFEDARGTISR